MRCKPCEGGAKTVVRRNTIGLLCPSHGKACRGVSFQSSNPLQHFYWNIKKTYYFIFKPITCTCYTLLNTCKLTHKEVAAEPPLLSVYFFSLFLLLGESFMHFITLRKVHSFWSQRRTDHTRPVVVQLPPNLVLKIHLIFTVYIYIFRNYFVR